MAAFMSILLLMTSLNDWLSLIKDATLLPTKFVVVSLPATNNKITKAMSSLSGMAANHQRQKIPLGMEGLLGR